VEGLDKLAYARVMLGCVAAIAQRQGDAFGLVVLTDGKVQYTPASRGPRQLQRVLAQLSAARPSGALPENDTLRSSLHFVRSPSVVCVASDFLDGPSPLSEALVRVRSMRHDVRALCLQTQAERDATFASGPAYRDPEAQGGVFRFGADLKEVYRRNREEHFAALTAECRKKDVPLLAACIEQAPGDVLRMWLRQRGRA
jgi:uncharacterized protein (DUF58 family)